LYCNGDPPWTWTQLLVEDEVRRVSVRSLLPHKSSLISLLACCKWCITFTSSLFRHLKVVSVRPSVRAPVFGTLAAFTKVSLFARPHEKGTDTTRARVFELRGDRALVASRNTLRRTPSIHNSMLDRIVPTPTGPGRGGDWLHQHEEATDSASARKDLETGFIVLSGNDSILNKAAGQVAEAQGV
jgi:hypothetical protein